MHLDFVKYPEGPVTGLLYAAAFAVAAKYSLNHPDFPAIAVKGVFKDSYFYRVVTRH